MVYSQSSRQKKIKLEKPLLSIPPSRTNPIVGRPRVPRIRTQRRTGHIILLRRLTRALVISRAMERNRRRAGLIRNRRSRVSTGPVWPVLLRRGCRRTANMRGGRWACWRYAATAAGSTVGGCRHGLCRRKVLLFR